MCECALWSHRVRARRPIPTIHVQLPMNLYARYPNDDIRWNESVQHVTSMPVAANSHFCLADYSNRLVRTINEPRPFKMVLSKSNPISFNQSHVLEVISIGCSSMMALNEPQNPLTLLGATEEMTREMAAMKMELRRTKIKYAHLRTDFMSLVVQMELALEGGVNLLNMAFRFKSIVQQFKQKCFGQTIEIDDELDEDGAGIAIKPEKKIKVEKKWKIELKGRADEDCIEIIEISDDEPETSKSNASNEVEKPKTQIKKEITDKVFTRDRSESDIECSSTEKKPNEGTVLGGVDEIEEAVGDAPNVNSTTASMPHEEQRPAENIDIDEDVTRDAISDNLPSCSGNSPMMASEMSERHNSNGNAENKAENCVEIDDNPSNIVSMQVAHASQSPLIARTEPVPEVKTYRKVKPKNRSTGRAKTFECYCCKRAFGAFGSEKLCRQHMQRICARRFPCNFCDKKFIQKNHLSAHLHTHYKQKRFVCDAVGCGKKYSKATNLKIHKQSHAKPFDGKTKKKGSGQQFVGLDHLNEHNYALNVPKRIYTAKRPFVRNENGHFAIRENAFVCTYRNCGKIYTTGYNLRRHEKIHVTAKRME